MFKETPVVLKKPLLECKRNPCWSLKKTLLELKRNPCRRNSIMFIESPGVLKGEALFLPSLNLLNFSSE